jgi:hypothetical protein
MKPINNFIVIFAFWSLLSGCQSTATVLENDNGSVMSQATREPTMEVKGLPVKIIPNPQTALETLKNFKSIMDNAWRIEKSFFTEDNAKVVFRGERISIFEEPKDVFIMSLQSLGYRSDIPGLNGSIKLQVSFKPDEKIRYLGLDILDPFNPSVRITFADIEKLFGTNWQKVPPQPNPHRIYKAATRAHGNEVIDYRFMHNTQVQEIRISFNPDAYLATLDITNVK